MFNPQQRSSGQANCLAHHWRPYWLLVCLQPLLACFFPLWSRTSTHLPSAPITYLPFICSCQPCSAIPSTAFIWALDFAPSASLPRSMTTEQTISGTPVSPPGLSVHWQEPRAPPIEKYDGTLETCCSFLTLCLLHFEVQQVTFAKERSKLALIITHLSGWMCQDTPP